MDNQRAATFHMFQRYKEILQNQDFDGPDKTSSAHLRWMCDEALGSDYPIDKLSRWLGFVQGVLIMQNVTTVEAERDYSRPLFKPESNG